MQERLKQLALEIDNALSNKADLNQLNDFLQNIEIMSEENISSFEKAQLNFYAANIHSFLKHSKVKTTEHLENEIYHLRLSHAAFEIIPPKLDDLDVRYRVETNLSNALSSVGRFIEALEKSDAVTKKCPHFGMAHGSKGLALFNYARQVYDQAQVPYLLKFSHLSIKKALDFGVEKQAEKFYRDHFDYLNSLDDWDNMSIDMDKKLKTINYDDFFCYLKNFPKLKLPRLNFVSKEEIKYRQWCLSNHLFLNPLNDILNTAYEASDDLHLPPVTTPISAAIPEIFGIYNQLKQEYISARYIFFEAADESKKYSVHFSDKKVNLINMLDARFYRLWVEKMKMAFLAAYAIFDKIAYLINEYWQLGLKTNRIDFHKIWFENADATKGMINSKLSIDKNLSIKGLYWLSKDIYYRNDKRPIEPDAKQLNYIRNHISHKYLKVQHSSNNPASSRKNNGHELTYPIDETELQEQTIKLLKLVRSALIYVSLAINWQEKNNLQTEPDKVFGMTMANVDDNQRW